MYKVLGKIQYDTATFIQDSGQVPFEPQIQKTFSMDKKSNCIVQSNAAPTLQSESLNQKRCKTQTPFYFYCRPSSASHIPFSRERRLLTERSYP
jgi:hypothetical protein